MPVPDTGVVECGNPVGSAAGKARNYARPVYLLTGQITVTGGINGSADTVAVKTPEVYTPDINWATRTYGAGAGSWETIEESAGVARTITRSPCYPTEVSRC